MPVPKSARFPSGWLVAALLVASGILWAVMFFGPLANLTRLAGGVPPFDIRPAGYSFAQAHDFLVSLGEAGRAYYYNPELVLDTFYPPLYAASRALALWWLTMPARLGEGAPKLRWRIALVAIPFIMASLDAIENACIGVMLGSWPDLSPRVVEIASTATRLKMIAGALTELSMAVLAAFAGRRWLKNRH